LLLLLLLLLLVLKLMLLLLLNRVVVDFGVVDDSRPVFK